VEHPKLERGQRHWRQDGKRLSIVGYGAGDRDGLPKLTVIGSALMLLENFFIGGASGPE